MASNIKYFNPIFKDKTTEELSNVIRIKARRTGMTFCFEKIMEEIMNREMFKDDEIKFYGKSVLVNTDKAILFTSAINFDKEVGHRFKKIENGK